MDPYRDEIATCPACAAPLRRFNERLCCDACSGIFLEQPDFVASLGELTSATCAIAFTHDQGPHRACPRCATPMTRANLEVTVDTKRVKASVALDRCTAHGIWFDNLALPRVYEEVHAAVSPAGFGRGRRLKIGRDEL